MVNPYDLEDEPLYYRLHHLNIFMASLSDMEIVLISCECVFIINIFINFFLQENDDAKIPLRENLANVAEKYFQGRFLLDVIVMLPIGYILAELIDKKLMFLMVIKGIRVIDINFYISDKFWGPYIRSTFTWVR